MTPAMDDLGGSYDPQEARSYFGKYPGLVLDRTPDGGGDHHRGELLVQVPGILEEDDSDPGGGERPLEVVARPCFAPGRFQVPQEGQQVWVEFAAGDINEPIWSGAWYPDGETPASVDGDRPTEDQQVIRTASGQVIQLEDSGGSERLILRDEANDNRITLDGEGIRIETPSCSIELSGSTIRLTNGSHTLELGSMGTKITDANGGGPHPAVLEPVLQWLTQWLPAHQHVGNMGGPTPLFPPDIADAVQLSLELHIGGEGVSGR